MNFDKIVTKWNSGFEKSVGAALVLVVLMMLVFSVLSIVLRWAQQSNLWLDPLVRHLVFLSAFLGGVIATGKGTHISIDILLRFLEVKEKKEAIKNLQRVIYLISIVVLFFLAKAAWNLTLIEFEFGKKSFLEIHSGFLVGITPVGFFLIAISYFNRFLMTFTKEN